MLLAIEGAAGAGKTTLRDRIIRAATAQGIAVSHIGQFSWLSTEATRVLVALRGGWSDLDEAAAMAAVYDDLVLHAQHNLSVGRACGHLVADRLVLSSACLLALRYPGPVEHYVERLASVAAARPEVTFVVTTPPAACAGRVGTRPTARRALEQPATAARLADLYVRAADAWADLTGDVVWRHPSLDESDIGLMVDEALDALRSGGPPVSRAASVRRP